MFDGKLNQFCKDVNEVVVSKGFWDGMHDSLHIMTDYSKEHQNVQEEALVVRQQTKDAFISQKIALIMSECGESLEAMRKNNYGLEKKDSFEDEIADVFIRLSDLCGELDIDIEKQIAWKLEHNKSRPAKHGKGF